MLSAMLQSALKPFLSVMNPATGDRNASILWIIVALLVVSAVVLVVMGLTSKKKKRK